MVNFGKLLQLERPLAVLDLETTGLNTEKDRIIQIAVTIHYDHREPIAWSSLVNPTVPILNTTHGLKDSDVASAPTFAQIAPALAPKLTNVDISGYYVDFDIAVLRSEMKRAGVSWPWKGYVIDPLQIYRRKFPHHLTNAYQEFGGENGEPLPRDTPVYEDAHNAGADVNASEVVLRGQLARFSDLPRTVKALSEYCFPPKPNAIDRDGKIIWFNGEACIAFGKYAKNGPCPLKDLSHNYMEWIISSDFPTDIKDIMRAALTGVYPTRDNK